MPEAALQRSESLVSGDHGPKFSARPIASLHGTSTHTLAKWMFTHLKFLAVGSTKTVASAKVFLERIKHLKFEPDESMVSVDVVSVFIFIPKQEAIDVVRQLIAKRYNESSKPLKSEHLLELLRHCLKAYFTFGAQMYEKGPPMGSPYEA
ncbi:unnamed protein product [Dibothriocephalus latus]|uniref:Uncharacterized protein n=1 Tax=Dibothriocephalus latus TaxID=60516 RepID=A0A3P6TA53_DIBLA|nr:unnamed protein product [Dibothriocephalus latus]